MTLIRHKPTLKQIAGFAFGSLLLISWVLPAVGWANGGVSQGFKTTQSNLAPGTVMGLKPDGHQVVVPAVSAERYQLLGIVADQPLIALNNGSNQVQIIISGSADALVSDINGAVKVGDKITASPISGVGMKAIDAGQIVGTAQASLADSNPSKRTVTDKTGKVRTILIGAVPIQVSVGYYSGDQSQGKLAAIIPPFLTSFAGSITGQTVSALRILISLLVLIIGFVVAANMLQASIRAGIVALGRNPLARQSIRRELFDISMTALGVLALTIIVVYLIIKF